MTEEILDDPEVGAPLEKMGGKAVTQRVRKRGQPPADNPTETPTVQDSTTNAHPERLSGTVSNQQRTGECQIVRHGPTCRYPQGNHPRLVPLSDDSQRISADIAHLQRGQFRDPEPGRIQHFDDGSVPNPDRVGSVQLFDGTDELPAGYGVRQGSVELGAGDSLERVGGQLSPSRPIRVKTRNRRRFPGDRTPRIATGVEKCEETAGKAAIDCIDTDNPISIAEVEELPEITPIGGNRVGRQTALFVKSFQVPLYGFSCPLRAVGKIHRLRCYPDASLEPGFGEDAVTLPPEFTPGLSLANSTQDLRNRATPDCRQVIDGHPFRWCVNA